VSGVRARLQFSSMQVLARDAPRQGGGAFRVWIQQGKTLPKGVASKGVASKGVASRLLCNHPSRGMSVAHSCRLSFKGRMKEGAVIALGTCWDLHHDPSLTGSFN